MLRLIVLALLLNVLPRESHKLVKSKEANKISVVAFLEEKNIPLMHEFQIQY